MILWTPSAFRSATSAWSRRLSGEQAPEGEFAGPKQKGILADILQPGLYYVNPREFKVDVLEIGVNQVSLLGKGGAAVITKAQIVTQNRAMDELQSKVLMEQKDKRAEYLSGAGSMLQQAAPAAPKGKPARRWSGSRRKRTRRQRLC